MDVDEGNRTVGVLAVAAVASSPLWFLQPLPVNFGVVDFLLVAAGVAYVWDTRTWILFPSRPIAVGILVFLLGCAISIAFSPVPLDSFLNFLQYVLIFGITVPIILGAFRSRRRRWYALLGLWVVLNFVTVVAFWESLSFQLERMNRLELWYGNANNLYWIVGSAVVVDGCMILEKRVASWIKVASGVPLVLAVYLLAVGISFSAWLLALVAGWLTVLTYILTYHEERRRPLLAGLLATTSLGGMVSLAFAYRYWEFFYVGGNLGKRQFMYAQALKEGAVHFPFGAGLDSSVVVMDDRMASYPDVIARSIHNFILSYYVEAGVLAVVGITIVIVYWISEVLVASLMNAAGFHLFELIPTLLFAGYLVVLLFQNVPVHRFWWILFGLSWATVLSNTPPDRRSLQPPDEQ